MSIITKSILIAIAIKLTSAFSDDQETEFSLDCTQASGCGIEAIGSYDNNGGLNCVRFINCNNSLKFRVSSWINHVFSECKGENDDRVCQYKIKCRGSGLALAYVSGIRYNISKGTNKEKSIHSMELKCSYYIDPTACTQCKLKHIDETEPSFRIQQSATNGQLIAGLWIPVAQPQMNRTTVDAYTICDFKFADPGTGPCEQRADFNGKSTEMSKSVAITPTQKISPGTEDTSKTNQEKEEEKEETQSETDRRIVERVRREIEERNRKMKPITTTPKPKPKPPLTEAEKIIAKMSRDLGCAFIVLACLISIGISIFLRNSFSERILHLCQELCLLCEHLTMFWALWGMDKEKKHHCYLTSTLMQFFGVANMAFIFLESLDAYGVITNMVFQGNLFPTQTYIFTGFAIPLGIFIPTALWLYEVYPSEYSCWINWSHRAVATTFAMSVFILGMCAIILAEMAGMWRDTIIIERNRKRVHLARINRMGVLMIVPLQFVSELVGSFAMHHMNLLLIAQVLIFNIVLAVTVLTAHTIGNKQVYDALLKVWGKIRKKPTPP